VRLRGHKHHGGKYDGKLALVFGRTAKKYRVWVEGVDHQLEYYPEKFILAETISTPTTSEVKGQTAALTDTTELSAGAAQTTSGQPQDVETTTQVSTTQVKSKTEDPTQADSIAASRGTQAPAQSNASNDADTASNTHQVDEDQRGLPSLRVEQFKHQSQAASMACVVCKQVPVNEWEPLELRCKHLFCWGCLKKALAAKKECPHCGRQLPYPKSKFPRKQIRPSRTFCC